MGKARPDSDGRMVSAERRRLFQALRAIELHYLEHKPHKDIAKELRVSSATVSRLLEFGRQQGLVQISVSPPRDIAKAATIQGLLKQFGVRHVDVAGDSQLHVGEYAAKYLKDNLKSNSVLVLDGGKTIDVMVRALPDHGLPKMRVVPICADPTNYNVSAVEHVARLALKCANVDPVKVPQFRGAILDSTHDDVRAIARDARIVVLGVGPWSPSFTALEFLKFLGHNPTEMMKRHKQVAAVVGYCPITTKCTYHAIDEVETLMPRALDFADIRRLAKSDDADVILLAHSAEKASAVALACQARACNMLIIDEGLADELIKQLS